jgi:cell division protein FtsA
MFDLIKNDKTFVVFDIGFGKIVCLSFKLENNQPKVIGMDYQKSEGLKNFCLSNSDKLSSTLQKVLKNTLGKNFKNKNNIFFSSITDINSIQKKNLCKINTGTLGVTKKDIRKIFKKNLLESKIKGKKIIHSFPQNFILDEDKITSQPITQKCANLGISSLNIMTDDNLFKDYENCFRKININVDNFFDSGISSAFSALTEKEKNDGVACIDIGASTTKVVVMQKNKVIFSKVLPLGGNNVTNDLYKGLQITREMAETIKILHGTLSPNFNNNIEIRMNSVQQKNINKNILFGIIKPRYEEILEIIRDFVFDNIYTRVSVKSIVLAGGASKIYGLNSLGENIFNRYCRISMSGVDHGFFSNKPEFSTILGMIKLAQNYKELQITKKILSSKVFNAIDRLDNWIEESYA